MSEGLQKLYLMRAMYKAVALDKPARLSGMGPALVIIAAWWLVSVCAWGGELYRVDFRATFDNGYGGLPTVELIGTYTFEVLPPTYGDNTSAYYMSSMRSSAFTLNGTSFQGTDGYLRVGNNIELPDPLRDGYYGLCSLNGAVYSNFAFYTAGLSFEQQGRPPSALNSIALPTSAADLAGFLPSEQTAVLTYRNPNTGVTSASYAPVHELQFTLVPEPGALTLIGLGVGLVVWQRKLRGLLQQPRVPERHVSSE